MFNNKICITKMCLVLNFFVFSFCSLGQLMTFIQRLWTISFIIIHHMIWSHQPPHIGNILGNIFSRSCHLWYYSMVEMANGEWRMLRIKSNQNHILTTLTTWKWKWKQTHRRFTFSDAGIVIALSIPTHIHTHTHTKPWKFEVAIVR